MAKQKSDHNKTIHASVAFTRRNKETGERFLAYLDHTGLSASRYIRGLVKADLDAKGWMLPGEETEHGDSGEIDSIDDKRDLDDREGSEREDRDIRYDH